MNCLSARFERIGGGTLRASVSRQFDGNASLLGGLVGVARRIKEFVTRASYTREFTCRVGIVCETSFGNEDVLWASDGIVFNVDGDKIYITLKS